MSGLVARLRALSPRHYALLAEATAALAVAAFVVAAIPFRRIAAFSGRSPPRGGPEGAAQRDLIRQVRWAVSAGARRAPWRAKCFEQGLAAQWMLRRRGVPVSLHYGVAQEEGRLIAHVWGRTGSIDVIGCENKGDFSELARFPASD